MLKNIKKFESIQIEKINAIHIFEDDNLILEYKNSGNDDISFHVSTDIDEKENTKLKSLVIEGDCSWVNKKDKNLTYMIYADGYPKF